MTNDMQQALRNWAKLNKMLNSFTEAEVKEMLDDELSHEVQRRDFVIRLHQRYSALRAAREREELFN
jgi:alpha-glucuronidase